MSDAALKQKQELEAKITSMGDQLRDIDAARQRNKISIMHSMSSGAEPKLELVQEGLAVRLRTQLRHAHSEVDQLKRKLRSSASASTRAALGPLIRQYSDLALQIGPLYAQIHCILRGVPNEAHFRNTPLTIPTGNHKEFAAIKEMHLPRMIRAAEDDLMKTQRAVVDEITGESNLSIIFSPLCALYGGKLPLSLGTGETLLPTGFHGMKLDTNGAVFATSVDPVVRYLNANPLDENGRLCVAIDAPVVQHDQGLGFAVNEALAVSSGEVERSTQGCGFSNAGQLVFTELV